MSGRRAKLERRLARTQRPPALPSARPAHGPVGPQRYEELHYRADVTTSDQAQPGAILGHDELGRPYEVLDTEFTPPQTHAEGHFDGDGCTFPTPGHFRRSGTTVNLQYATPDNLRAALVAAGIAS
ncbi:hypothetical protein [Blastococcus sp. CT_GayMR16]|uniref:hypothetical protein n=1 Tax=Blastococcus sp. CT_GayMR16 TaxID=2559607 RepID=UPI00107351AF|nr:hypothetical protein [Blastococcus sp. CT_GayMR16]TFV90430.1 hypothetical protein E4P38_03040 [Blastococcus sp. CT_GayMR16]